MLIISTKSLLCRNILLLLCPHIPSILCLFTLPEDELKGLGGEVQTSRKRSIYITRFETLNAFSKLRPFMLSEGLGKVVLYEYGTA